MNKTDEAAIEWAIRKYWREKTDVELARGLSTSRKTVTEKEVKAMREKIGFKRDQVGKESLKQFAQRYLLEMSDEMKAEFMSKLPKELIWRMAEGQPATSGSLDIGVEPIKIDITHQLEKVYGPKPVSFRELPQNS